MPKSRVQQVQNLVATHNENPVGIAGSAKPNPKKNINKTITNKNYRSFSGDKAYEVSFVNTSFGFGYFNKKIKISPARDSATPAQLLRNFPTSTRIHIKQALDHWVELKLPAPTKSNTKIQAYLALAYMLEFTDPQRLKQIFELYAECINSARGKLSKKQPMRVPLWRFVEWSEFDLSVVNHITFLAKEQSLFSAFLARTPDEIYTDFFQTATDDNPEITKVILTTWRKANKPLTQNSPLLARKAAGRFVEYLRDHKKRLVINDLPKVKRKKPENIVRYLIKLVLDDRPDFKLHYLNSDVFFDQVLPKLLKSRRMLLSADDVKNLTTRRKSRRKKPQGISGESYTPSWQK